LQKRKYGKSYSVGMYMGQSAPGAFNWMLYMRRSAPKVLVFTNNVARKSTFLTDNWRKSDLQQLEQPVFHLVQIWFEPKFTFPSNWYRYRTSWAKNINSRRKRLL